MSNERKKLHGRDRHAHFAPEDLLELALAQSSGRVQTELALARDHARARACPDCSLGLDAALADLGRVRAALVALPSIDARRTATLAEATIGLTTRERISRRGEWRVVPRFLRDGWGASLAVRCLAVSLLLHMIALPILAIVLALHVRREHPAPMAGAAPAPENPRTQLAIEPGRELAREPEPMIAGLFSSSLEAPTRSDRLAQARRDLLQAGSPRLSAFERQLGCSDGFAESVARLLIARSPHLGLRSFDVVVPKPAAESALAERAVCAELLLDDWASSGQVDRRLSAELWQLSEQGDASSTTPRGEAEPVPGVLERAARDGTELAGVSRGRAPSAAAERELFDAFEQAYASKLAVEPSGPLADWLAWGRGHAR